MKFISSALVFASFAIAGPAILSRQTGCADVTVIYARGTTETPPIGTTVGPLLQSDTQSAISPKTLSFQGVDYPADFDGFFAGGDPQGSQTMANMVTQTASSCPNSKIVMSGYSQGAQLVHNAAALISQSAANNVAAVVMFGDPKNRQSLGKGLDSKSLTFCNVGDNICDGGSLVLPPHLAYVSDTDEAAAFIASRV